MAKLPQGSFPSGNRSISFEGVGDKVVKKPYWRMAILLVLIISFFSFLTFDDSVGSDTSLYLGYYYPLLSSLELTVFSGFFVCMAFWSSRKALDYCLTIPYFLLNLINVLALLIPDCSYCNYIGSLGFIVVLVLLAITILQVSKLFFKDNTKDV